MIWLVFGVSFVLSFGFVWTIRLYCIRKGILVRPRDDRWHHEPTPSFGGVGIYLSFMITIGLAWLIRGDSDWTHWGLLAGSSAIFLLGVYDDTKKMSPPAKLVGQIMAASLVISMGYSTSFFTPKVTNPLLAQIPNIFLTFIWLVGITNALNLLDNMDGLAGGVSLITAMFLGYFFWQSNDLVLFVITAAFAGSITGFLIFNLPQASIFMGDSGSLFLGFTLAALAIARQPQASNVFAVIGVPTLLFLIPILDTIFVTITRLLRGQSPVQGGRDHTSHRLIAFGLTEKQTLLAIFAIAFLSGVAAINLETLDYGLSLALVPLLVISLSLLVAYLSRLTLVDTKTTLRTGTFSRLLIELTYRRRFFEIMLDFILIGLSYYLAYWFYGRFEIPENIFVLFLRSLPIAYVCAYFSLFFFRVYQGVWRYVSLDDLFKYGKAAISSALLAGGAINLFYSGQDFAPILFVYFGFFLFLCLTLTRSSFKIFDIMLNRRRSLDEERVLILGSGDSAEMAIRWILMNPKIGFYPVGLLDNDPYNTGKQIHGISIIGHVNQLEMIFDNKKIDGVVLTSDPNIPDDIINDVIATCHARGKWVRNLRLDFEMVK